MSSKALVLWSWGLIACGGMPSGGPPNGVPPAVSRPAELDAVMLQSEKGGAQSHNEGQNCMSCHGPNGLGKGRFSVAGTVFRSDKSTNPNAQVELWTGPNATGTLKLVLSTDTKGNYYSTAAMPFPDEKLFPSVVNTTTMTRSNMSFPTMSGACNVCHNPALRVSVD